MSRPMNAHVGSSYGLVGIGRVWYADEATQIPSVLHDDGYSTSEQHDHILSIFRHYNLHWEITTDGVWEHMPFLDHTGNKHHYLNITVKRK